MAKADRLARLDDRRVEMEAEYRALLIAALQRTAAKRLHVFGHSKDRATVAAAAPVIDELTALGDDIDSARDQLSIAPFDLHRQFLAARGPVTAHAVGEAKQAQTWLDRLEKTETST